MNSVSNILADFRQSAAFCKYEVHISSEGSTNSSLPSFSNLLKKTGLYIELLHAPEYHMISDYCFYELRIQIKFSYLYIDLSAPIRYRQVPGLGRWKLLSALVVALVVSGIVGGQQFTPRPMSPTTATITPTVTTVIGTQKTVAPVGSINYYLSLLESNGTQPYV